MKWLYLAFVVFFVSLGWWVFMSFVLDSVVYPLTRRWREAPIVDDPWSKAMDLAEEGDWRGRRFLDATEQVAEIEGQLVETFKAALPNKLGVGVPFLDIVDGLQELHKRVVPQGSSGVEKEES